MKQPKTVEVTIHIHKGRLVAACPDPCIVERGDTIVWKTCDPQDSHFLSIENFREKASGLAHNPMTKGGYDLGPQSNASGDVDGAADEMTYTYTVRMVEGPTLIAHANEYIKKLAFVGASPVAQVAGPAVPGAQADLAAVDSRILGPLHLTSHLLRLFGSQENFLSFAKMMMCSYSDQEMDPEVEVGGTGG